MMDDVEMEAVSKLVVVLDFESGAIMDAASEPVVTVGRMVDGV